MAVEIRVLGSFDVVQDGQSLALGGPRQRTVAAVLAVHANETVSLDRLVDEVWAGQPPAAAVVTLRRYVSRLRQALAGLPLSIETRRPGYVLLVEPDLIDARRFERLVEEGRRLLSEGVPDAAATSLREALALVRGEPLADFVYEPFARFETTRLEELLATAVELRIDADLAAGRHREVVPELEALVAAHPLRESYRGQLMRALHGSGRRVEALRVYSEGRHMMADEVGLDPGAPLQQLEHAILVGESEGETGRLDRAPSPRRRLPAELTSFVGRSTEVEEISELLLRSRLVTLTGVGGAGKSRLAARVAAVVGPSLSGAASIVELSAVSDPAIVPRVVAQALGVREDPDQDIVDTLVDALRDEDALIVVDGCEHLLDAVAPLVERILSAAAGIRVLATSREPLDLPGEAVFSVPTLAVPAADEACDTVASVMRFDAVRLFVERATAADRQFRPTDADAAAVAEICRRLDGLPLALELAAARADVLTLHQLADRVEDRFELLNEGRRTAPARHRTLRATIGWSYDLLNDEERWLFDRLSVFAGSFTVETAEAVCGGDGIEPPDVVRLLIRLVRKSLVVRVSSSGTTARYRMLDTIRDYARERLKARGETASLHARHAAVFTELAERSGPALRGPSVVRVLDELDTEHVEFRAALAWLLESGDAEGSCRLAAALVPFWDFRYYIRDGQMWLRRVLGLARKAGRPSRHWLWAVIGAAFFAMRIDGDETEALCDEGHRLLESVTDDLAEAKLWVARAEFIRYRDENDLAHTLCTRAVERCRSLGDTWGEADVFRMLTLVAQDRGDFDSATATAAECLRLYQLTGDIEKTAGAQTLVAALARDRGEFGRAAELLEESLARFQQVGEPLGIGVSLWRLAVTALMQGDYDAATRFGEQALQLHLAMEYPRAIGQDYQVLTEAALARGDLEEAESWFELMMRHYRNRGFRGDIIAGLAVGAMIWIAHGMLEGALAYVDEALRYAHDLRYTGDTGVLLRLRAEVRLRQGFVAESEELAEEALAACRLTGNGRAVAMARVTLACAHLAGGRPDEAGDQLRQAKAGLAAAGVALARTEAETFEAVADAVGKALGAAGSLTP